MKPQSNDPAHSEVYAENGGNTEKVVEGNCK
jgi:hypothetical protein